MNFEAEGALATFQTFIDKLAGRHRDSWAGDGGRCAYSPSLDRDLEEGGYFAAATEAELGLPAAVAMVLELSRLPACAELAASALVGPIVCPEMPRPLAVVWNDRRRPVRFLPMARTVLAADDGHVTVARLQAGDVEPAESLFAYPMGLLRHPDALPWQRVEAARRNRLPDLWRLGVAAEITGSLLGALACVADHVTQRRQFGRALGAFQGIQHRLASAASLIEGSRWLVLKAATTGAPIDAAAAIASAQAMARTIVYDLHQFLGAMGLTLEHPLHRWTYRVKLLRSELGGAERNAQALADLAWGLAPTAAGSELAP
jgi:alkylation response protein AidB-like acyl-CoA dehydrogenase